MLDINRELLKRVLVMIQQYVAAAMVAFAVAPLPSLPASETAGVLPSWWIPEVPSVVIPGARNTSDAVVMRTDSGKLLVAAAGRVKEENGVRLSGRRSLPDRSKEIRISIFTAPVMLVRKWRSFSNPT